MKTGSGDEALPRIARERSSPLVPGTASERPHRAGQCGAPAPHHLQPPPRR
jgi:hypothetical protein